ncbi:Uncharacterised protein [Mycobacteroides abscessus subsp. abscessus]|nr:Uncharacterised protein [Mycobacteroides abscessus subsp. abscessus]
MPSPRVCSPGPSVTVPSTTRPSTVPPLTVTGSDTWTTTSVVMSTVVAVVTVGGIDAPTS